MNIDIDEVDVERLRQDLIDYFGCAMFTISPVAMVDLTKVETASDEELIRIALANKFDLSNYIYQRKK